MNKLLILLVCLFGLSMLYEASAHGIDPCKLTYYNVPPAPVCKWVTKNGKRVQECTPGKSTAYAALIDDHSLSFRKPTFALNNLKFSGECACTLTLYSLANYKGTSFGYAFSKSKTKNIYAKTIWKTPTKSFKVVCTFPV